MNYPRNVSILVFDDVEVLDFSGPYEVFNVAAAFTTPPPFSVFSVGITGKAILGRGHFTFTPRYSIENSPQADILIVPRRLWNTSLAETRRSHQMDFGAGREGGVAFVRVHRCAPAGKGRPSPELRRNNAPYGL